MRLTTERKLCGGVLLLAVVALGVDRFILGGAGGPAAASAAQFLPTVDATPTTPSRVAIAATGMSIPVAKQLADLKAPAQPRDGFAPPGRWLEAIALAEAAAAKEPQVANAAGELPVDTATARFRNHQLTAVLSEQGQPTMALVKTAPDGSSGGTTHRIGFGEKLDGFTLISFDIKKRSATFRHPSGESAVTLQIALTGEDEKSE